MLLCDIIKNHPSEKNAFIFKDKTTTYGEFRKKVNRWSAFLQEQGIQKGDRVGLFSKNSPDFISAYFAVVNIGAIVVPFNFQLIAPEIAYIVKDTEMKILLTRNKLDVDRALLELGWEVPLKQFTFEEMIPSAEEDPVLPAMKENDPAAIIYTSGTTGRPKGAMLSQRNLLHNTDDFVAVVEIKPDDITLCVLPMYHCFGWICSVMANLRHGATLVIQETYIFNDAMLLIKKHGVNTICGVPTMFQLFVKGAEPEELAGFRYFVSGGAPLPRILYDAFARKFGQHVQEGYGLSEATPVTTFNPSHKTKQGSIGLPIPHVEVRLVDENFNEVAVGEVGELCVKGPNVMLEYWRRPKETAYTLRNGWLHTEDLAIRDEEGYIFIVDRLKDMIISSGENVYPREIEEILIAHPDIKEAAVVGIPDKLRGQAICAYVVWEDGGTADKRMLRKYLLSKVAPYKVPKEFVFCEQLPRNNTGKVLKSVLREKAMVDLVNRKRV